MLSAVLTGNLEVIIMQMSKQVKLGSNPQTLTRVLPGGKRLWLTWIRASHSDGAIFHLL